MRPRRSRRRARTSPNTPRAARLGRVAAPSAITPVRTAHLCPSRRALTTDARSCAPLGYSEAMRALLPLAVAAVAASCGFQGSPYLDGDRPILIEDSPWPAAAAFAQTQWNPRAAGAPQRVLVRLDDSGRCAREPLLSGFAVAIPPTIVRCPSFAPASDDDARWLFAHELGHLLGGGHVSAPSNVMCGPQPCPPVWRYTAIDVAEVCRYGRGGRCAATP